MKRLRAMLHRLFREEAGATVVEYGVVLALIIAGLIIIVLVLGNQLQKGFSDFNAAFQAARTGQ